MKKLLLCAAIAVFGLTNVNAQGGFNAGASLGLPIGDAGDFTTFNITLDANYLWGLSDSVGIGVATGYSHYFGDSINIVTTSIDYDDQQFLPIAAAGRFNLSDKFKLGADIGYAVGINDDNDGGFYYAPKAQYGVSELIDIVLAYRSISVEGGSFDALTLGVEFGF
ncbi:outer membrane beta-barrel protein [Flavivirga aquimarina]|uniref:Outer membrane beta-barrel protein n=1 Tax=Flavivirga aquimarina TaxID=2027862 RepID=A0ABT8WFB4_9FLAO|nr:outer membrane beta-barrel protein [Flavivirga aquimarina]MDO5971849.1 outer membrane beta-barrel protein [Flavivirga aquimarina]